MSDTRSRSADSRAPSSLARAKSCSRCVSIPRSDAASSVEATNFWRHSLYLARQDFSACSASCSCAWYCSRMRRTRASYCRSFSSVRRVFSSSNLPMTMLIWRSRSARSSSRTAASFVLSCAACFRMNMSSQLSFSIASCSLRAATSRSWRCELSRSSLSVSCLSASEAASSACRRAVNSARASSRARATSRWPSALSAACSSSSRRRSAWKSRSAATARSSASFWASSRAAATASACAARFCVAVSASSALCAAATASMSAAVDGRASRTRAISALCSCIRRWISGSSPLTVMSLIRLVCSLIHFSRRCFSAVAAASFRFRSSALCPSRSSSRRAANLVSAPLSWATNCSQRSLRAFLS
mmetsp:Transcript_33985/g.102496  ORF Transcript_33985/g.102496 Transcript_33985/m.102496 type:complete len:360 (+) Transcript_33985:2698-3777(+)